jgi:CubicO group peptidase (beta-lactamase class C family)
LPLETPLGKVKPGLNTRAAAATFHELLSHTSGLRDRQGDSGSDDELALASSARELTDAAFLFPAGLVFSYSNYGYALAGAGLESIIKKGFAEALRDAALAPLGMERSTMRRSEAEAKRHAVGHRLDGEATIAALIHQGRVPDQPGLPRDVIEKVTTPHTPMPNVFVGGHYGYGLMIARERDVLIYEHGGTLPGFSAILRVAPERQLGLAIVANLDNAPLRRVAQVVMSRALNLPASSPPPREEIAVSVAEMKPLLGRYENRGRVDLIARGEDVVFVLDDGAPLVVTRVGENRYIARPKPGAPGPEFVVQPGTKETPGYLHFALWAYRR